MRLAVKMDRTEPSVLCMYHKQKQQMEAACYRTENDIASCGGRDTVVCSPTCVLVGTLPQCNREWELPLGPHPHWIMCDGRAFTPGDGFPSNSLLVSTKVLESIDFKAWRQEHKGKPSAESLICRYEFHHLIHIWCYSRLLSWSVIK